MKEEARIVWDQIIKDLKNYAKEFLVHYRSNDWSKIREW